MTIQSELAAATDWIIPDWPAPENVNALITTRRGGTSRGCFASLNLSQHVGDEFACVQQNRAILRQYLPAEPKWLRQVHGTRVVNADQLNDMPEPADASFSRRKATVCAVLMADCLPVLLCDRHGERVAVAHAGWRGLCAGVVETTLAAIEMPAADLLAFLGPAIGPQAFEVGEQLKRAFIAVQPSAESAFSRSAEGKWFADLHALARQRLQQCGVQQIYHSFCCTYSESERFFHIAATERQGAWRP